MAGCIANKTVAIIGGKGEEDRWWVSISPHHHFLHLSLSLQFPNISLFISQGNKWGKWGSEGKEGGKKHSLIFTRWHSWHVHGCQTPGKQPLLTPPTSLPPPPPFPLHLPHFFSSSLAHFLLSSSSFPFSPPYPFLLRPLCPLLILFLLIFIAARPWDFRQ